MLRMEYAMFISLEFDADNTAIKERALAKENHQREVTTKNPLNFEYTNRLYDLFV